MVRALIIDSPPMGASSDGSGECVIGILSAGRFWLVVFEAAGRTWTVVDAADGSFVGAFSSKAEGRHFPAWLGELQRSLEAVGADPGALEQALELWPDGWDSWGRGVPGPIADYRTFAHRGAVARCASRVGAAYGGDFSTEASQARIRRGFRLSVEAHEAAISSLEFEPEASLVLDLLERSPRQKGLMEELVGNGLTTGELSCELAAYWMHELRFPSVRRLLTEFVDKADDPREARALETVIQAFEDGWDGAAVYERYGASRRSVEEPWAVADHADTDRSAQEVADEIVEIDLTAEEWRLLRSGLAEWGGPARCTNEMAVALGFEDRAHLSSETWERLLPEMDARQPLSRLDWLRVLLATEVVFASDVMGSGSEWPITVGVSDADTILMLRGLQRKIGREVRRLVGKGFGTR